MKIMPEAFVLPMFSSIPNTCNCKVLQNSIEVSEKLICFVCLSKIQFQKTPVKHDRNHAEISLFVRFSSSMKSLFEGYTNTHNRGTMSNDLI